MKIDDDMKIKLMNQISQEGLKLFDNRFEVGEKIENEDALLVRSASLHDYPMNSHLKAIARAGAGVNNIPIEKCSEKGIVVFNTPGANANAVKELVICGLLLSSRKIVEGIEWVKGTEGSENLNSVIEKGKKQFIGPEIEGKTLGIIGLGAIGVAVANAAISLGMNVLGYDPYLSLDSAWGLSQWVKNASSLEEICQECDYISIHAPSAKETYHMINQTHFASMKKGVRLLNFARADLVDSSALLEAIEKGIVEKYVTDFVVEDYFHQERILMLPHLGASTPESEENCAKMAVKELQDYLLNGNVIHSVNFPDVNATRKTKYRICLIHKNVPNMLAQFASVLAHQKINIEHMMNSAKGEYAYTMIDTNDYVSQTLFENVEYVIRVRVIE